MLKGYNMDYHALQQKLFALDPTDPREDLAKLQQAAQKGAVDAVPTTDYVAESVEVPQGSLELDRDYSVSDFAALAGVNVNEGAWDAFKTGYDNYKDPKVLKRAADAMGPGDAPQTKPSKSSSNTDSTDDTDTNTAPSAPPTNLNQLSQGDSFKDAKGMVWYYNPNKKNWMSKDRKQIISPEEGFKRWMQSASPRKRGTRESQIEALESRIAYLEDVIETLIEAKDERKIKPRDPNAQTMNDLRSSGASGVHQDQNKKKQTPRKAKHKNKQYESIKEELWAKLNAAGKS